MGARDFVFTYEGDEFRFSDLTLAEAEEIETKLDVSWGELRPIGLAKHRLTLMAIFLRRQRSEEEVAKILEATKLYESEAMWDIVPVDLPDEFEDGIPKAGAEPSTPSS